jgi:hypothetical protein
MSAVVKRPTFSTSHPAILPLIGTRADDDIAFEYLPVSVGLLQTRFAIPEWVTLRETLSINDLVRFHISFTIVDATFNQGTITNADWDKALGCIVYTAHFTPGGGPTNVARLSVVGSGTQTLGGAQLDIRGPGNLSDKDLMVKVFGDLVHLKRGIAVYLEHLFPYFSRISEYPSKDLQALRSLVMDQVSRTLSVKCSRLREIYDRLRRDGRSFEEIFSAIDFEELRGLVESEVPLEVLSNTFATPNGTPTIRSPQPYLNAIRHLENASYMNFNAMRALESRARRSRSGVPQLLSA